MKSRLNITEEWIHKLEDREVEITDSEQKKRKNNEKKWGLFRRLWHQQSYTHIIEVPGEEEKDKGSENTSEDKIAENSSSMGKEPDIQVQEAQSPK